MGRTVRGGNRNHTPNVRPVQKVELSEKNTRQRFIAVIVLLVIASGAFMYALNGLMSNDSGWTNIEVGSSAEIHCGDDYIFRYYVGAAGVNATAEKKALTLLYTDSIVKAYKMFSMDESFEGITNVYDLNRHPNETMVVDDALYHAFELIAETETGQFILRLCIQNMTICFSVMMTLRQLTMMLTRMGKWQLIFQRWLLTAMIRLT